jgi:hypothetical protein
MGRAGLFRTDDGDGSAARASVESSVGFGLVGDEPETDRRCGTCAAFTRVHVDAARGRIGECALEVFPPPVSARSTCSRYRPRGASAPPPPPRAAGEPRGHRGGVAPAIAPAPRRELPKEIDIDMDIDEFRRVLREVLADELGVGRADLGGRWQGGELVLKPGREGTAEKRVPIEAFFHKIVMLRDRLRVLEQKVNGHDKLTDEDKVQLQQYITACYGTLTTFNVLFAQREEGFTGASGKDD